MKEKIFKVILGVALSMLMVPAVSFADTTTTHQVTVKTANFNAIKVSDTARAFKSETSAANKVNLEVDSSGKITNVVGDAPTFTGWTFKGWYVEPVKYVYWGDKTTTTGRDLEEIPEGVTTDVDGNKPNEKELAENDSYDQKNGGTVKAYGIWIVAAGNGTNKGTPVVGADYKTIQDQTIYAAYTPNTVKYQVNWNGWNKWTGSIHRTRQYGTPFGIGELGNWSGYNFTGWKTVDDSSAQKTNFYDTPQAGATYYATWTKSSDPTNINSTNFAWNGWDTLQSISIRNETGTKIYTANNGVTMDDTAARPFVKVIAQTDPKDNGISQIDWEITGASGFEIVYPSNDKMSATIYYDGNNRQSDIKATLTVKAGKDKKIIASTPITFTAHKYERTEVLSYGNCSTPTKYRNHCVITGHTDYVDTEYTARHTWAYRDVPATCTTDHYWQRYCKVCGYVDSNPATGVWKQSGPNGHHFSNPTTVSTCGGTATTKVCTICGYTETKQTGSANHNWGTEQVIKPATCDSEGTIAIKCTNPGCGVIKDGSVKTIPHTTHDFSGVETNVVQPIGGKAGSKTVKCINCYATTTLTIPPQGSSGEVTINTSADSIANSVTTNTNSASDTSASNTLKNTIKELLETKSSDLATNILDSALLQSSISAEIEVDDDITPTTSDESKFSSSIASNATTKYVGINIGVKTNGATIGTITETTSPIKFTVTLPSTNGKVKVLRLHNNTVQELSSTVKGNLVTFSSDQFSTFAVVVTPTSTGSNGYGESVGSGSNDGSSVVGDGGTVSGGSVSGGVGDGSAVGGGTNGSTSGETTETVPNEGEVTEPPATSPMPSYSDFVDLLADQWYTDSVKYVLEKGLMHGSGNEFTPYDTTSRAMVATVLYRLVGEPAAENTAFADVDAGQWYTEAMNWAKETGVLQGADGEFLPNRPVTREQLVLMLQRFAKNNGYDVANYEGKDYSSQFVDSDKVSNWAKEAMSWAYGLKLINGKGGVEIAPQDGTQRVELATFLERYCRNIAKIG